jgi:glycosyltransferase involved in cell wall biosynthesis
MSDNPTLGVVVCSYNGVAKLAACFEALASQKAKVDVLVVDDGSTDGTEALARNYGFPVIRHESNMGISVARNTGLMNSTSRIVAYCDDDCVPPSNWTERLLTAWDANDQATVIGGTVEVDNPVTFTQRYLVYRNPLVPAEISLAHTPSVWYRLARQFRPPRLPTDTAFAVYSVVGANMSMDRARVLAVGGFDNTLVFGEGEETSLCVSVRDRFGENSVLVDPRVVLSHRFDPSMLKTWRRSFAYGRGAGERWRKQYGWPSLPVVGPSAVAASLIASAFSWPLAVVLGLAILGTPYGFWISRSRGEADARSVVFPFVALADDLVSVLGFVRGASRGSGPRRPSSSSLHE